MLFVCAPLQGSAGRAAFGSALPFSLRGLSMVKSNDTALIAEYERLRHEAYQLNLWSEQIDARLVELEQIQPDDYTSSRDSPDNPHTMLPGPLALPQRIIFLKQAITIARVGPWKLYPGLAEIEMSFEWIELFAVTRPPATFPEYLKLIDPDDRQRVAAETKHVFLLSEAKRWESTFRRAGRLILARAVAISPGHVIGVDIDITRKNMR